ncbi:hypothetical protein BC628DRAFT_986319 [Trametes gibbosa]|nr:hypothetical protein BC628DRAFT_986319 [Trametes gibbosa]
MPLLGDTVEASREKRIERQQARFRDRGGIFKPSERNALLDILLSRGVNGESPSRANSPRRSPSRSASPVPPAYGVVPSQQQEQDESDLAGPAPSKPKATRRTTKSKKSTASDSTTRSKRPAKRKAPSPDPEPTVEPLQEQIACVASDDEALAPRKRARIQRAASVNDKPAVHPRIMATEDDGNLRKQYVDHKVTNNTHILEAAQQSSSNEARTGVNTVTQEKGLRKGKHKAKTSHADSLSEKAPAKRLKKVPARPRPTAIAESDAEAEAGVVKQRTKRRGANTMPDPGPAGNSSTDYPLPPSQHATTFDDDAELPPPNYRRDRIVLNVPSSPDVPLAKALKSAQQSLERPLLVCKHPNASQDMENDHPVSPPRKRRRPEDVVAPVASRAQKAKGAKPPLAKGNTARNVSRTKAPPVYAPKGTVLRPKPKPRLSMFPAPQADDESDNDPIDFLS